MIQMLNSLQTINNNQLDISICDSIVKHDINPIFFELFNLIIQRLPLFVQYEHIIDTFFDIENVHIFQLDNEVIACLNFEDTNAKNIFNKMNKSVLVQNNIWYPLELTYIRDNIIYKSNPYKQIDKNITDSKKITKRAKKYIIKNEKIVLKNIINNNKINNNIDQYKNSELIINKSITNIQSCIEQNIQLNNELIINKSIFSHIDLLKKHYNKNVKYIRKNRIWFNKLVSLIIFITIIIFGLLLL